MTLVSVVVPTLNAEKDLRNCLVSVHQQTGVDVEIIVVDSLSSDSTPRIAESLGTLISKDCGMTLGRLEGTRIARGEFVLNLDADQVLLPHALESAVGEDKDAVVFEERCMGEGLVATVNRLDRDTVYKAWRQNIEPVRGSLVPRFYRRQLLLKALESIPARFIDTRPCPGSEDSVIFYFSGIAPGRVGFVPNGMLHHEEGSLTTYLKKWYARGRAAKNYRGTEMEFFVTHKGGRRTDDRSWMLSLPGLLLRGAPFLIGYYL